MAAATRPSTIPASLLLFTSRLARILLSKYASTNRFLTCDQIAGISPLLPGGVSSEIFSCNSRWRLRFQLIIQSGASDPQIHWPLTSRPSRVLVPGGTFTRGGEAFWYSVNSASSRLNSSIEWSSPGCISKLSVAKISIGEQAHHDAIDYPERKSTRMTSRRIAVQIAVDAAKNCIHVFEQEYPGDLRPRETLEAAEQWLANPDSVNLNEIEHLEVRVWRSRDWQGRAAGAATACACAARAIRCPQSSAKGAIVNECFANGIEMNSDYAKRSLWRLIHRTNFC